jgi:protein-L-isoaspartate(D-aspartate) O-methyltransferase
MLEDNYRHRGMRKALIRILKEKGITHPEVLRVMEKVPRHFFFEKAFLEHAYQDKAFPIGEGQTISQPYTVAFQTQLLAPKPGDKVLEIGTGSGYQAAILAEMGVKLFTVEFNRHLYTRASQLLLTQLHYNIKMYCGDGSVGLPVYAPFDKIIVTAGAPAVPKTLVDQLNTGGSLVIPVGNNEKQQMLRITRAEDNKIIKETFQIFSFVPLLGKNGWK